MENEESKKSLLAEMIQGLTEDVSEVKRLLADQPKPTPPPDLEPFLKQVAEAVNGLIGQVKILTTQKAQPQASVTDSSEQLSELRAIRRELHQSPANRINKVVQYGAGLLVVSLLVTGVLAYYATKWRAERDAFEVSDWKWRVIRQTDAVYAADADANFELDSTSERTKAWVLKQEQADATREAARRAADQAKAMEVEADKLEGKTGAKGRKKSESATR